MSADEWQYTQGDRQEIERWRGDPDKFAIIRGIARYDYALIPSSRVTFTFGRETGKTGISANPGTIFDITIPICDVGCMLLFAADIADSCSDNLDIAVSYSFSGLRGRRLDMSLGWFERNIDFISDVDVFCIPVQMFSARQIKTDLRRVLLGLMTPLYSEFTGYVLDRGLIDHYVHQEILGNYPGGSVSDNVSRNVHTSRHGPVCSWLRRRSKRLFTQSPSPPAADPDSDALGRRSREVPAQLRAKSVGATL